MNEYVLIILGLIAVVAGYDVLDILSAVSKYLKAAAERAIQQAAYYENQAELLDYDIVALEDEADEYEQYLNNLETQLHESLDKVDAMLYGLSKLETSISNLEPTPAPANESVEVTDASNTVSTSESGSGQASSSV
jgi:chromosome segregation ATPase